MTFQLIYWVTNPQIHPKVNLPVYAHASLSSNHKDLPVTTTTCVPAHICTRSWSLPVHFHTFISINRLDLPINVSTVLHVHRRTCSSLYCSACPQMYLFITVPVQFISSFPAQYAQCSLNSHLGTYPQIHPKIFVPVYPHASPLPKNNDLPVPTATLCTCPYLFPFMTLPVQFQTFIQINR